MTKREAIEQMVERRFSPIPQEWVMIVAERKEEYHNLPMWGTMWFIDSVWGEILFNNARLLEDWDSKESDKWNDKNADEEMMGERCVLDKDGNRTAVYIYEIEGEYLIGVNGAGWNFYDGVWDKLYDLLGLEWHNEE